jgi:hypothetical protein
MDCGFAAVHAGCARSTDHRAFGAASVNSREGLARQGALCPRPAGAVHSLDAKDAVLAEGVADEHG